MSWEQVSCRKMGDVGLRAGSTVSIVNGGLQGGGTEGQHPRKKSRDMRQRAGKGPTPCPPKPFTPQAGPVCPQLCLSWFWNYPY